MKPVNKEQFLSRLENKVESHLQEAIRVFQNINEETLLRPATNGGWSIAQCLDHLNSYGQYYLPYIQKGLNKNINLVNPDTFQSSWLGNYFTRLIDPETGKKKQKSAKIHQPAHNLDAHAVVAEFIQQQETLLAYIKQSRQVDLNKIKIPVSILKWIKLNLGDVLQFLIAHNERHLQQAKQNLLQPNILTATASV
ncbi:DinB family protein [Adhaeribacter rhizoryzae]|uniref:DinB family protein n=1 Tax=Adhaeribacter rhizoryzae TaxID=2607907 RepID=A0A5M6DFZ9_9BACT|nr:DinB family protein [Adhaeribacter rhizoryzae]KAA5546494.1 DinB family protein [Adhaeribacter rhizoryzae]